MRKLTILLLAFVALTGFNSCTSDDDVVFIAQPDPEGIAFTNTFSPEYILTKETAENTAERFVWNEIDLDVPTNVNYDLMASTSQDMSDPVLMGSTTGTNLAVKVKQLLSLAKDAGLDNDPATEATNSGTLYFQVVATAGTAGEMLHESEIQPLNIVLPETTGEEDEDLREFYLVGNATPDNWNNNGNNTPLFRDATNPDLYYYTGRFVAGEFKLLEVKGQWQPQWGLQDGELTNSDILGGDPGAFVVDSEGYYTLTVNADEMTYSFEPYDASGAATYSTIGLIGPAQAGGWDTDTDMTQLEFDPHIWYINDIELADGEFKFRADDDWADNWGTASDALSGQANYSSNENMIAEAGVYDIWFNDLTGRYILIPQSQE